MIRQRIVAGLVAGVAIVGLAACGSDSKSSDTSAKAATTTVADTEDTTATTKSENTTATTDDTDITTGDTDTDISDVTAPELTGNCVELGKDMESLFGTDFDPTTASPDDIKDVFDKLKSKVPSDLKDDVDTLRDAVIPFYAALSDAGGDMTKALQSADGQKAVAAMNSTDVQAASAALDDWTSKGCPS